MSEVRTLLHAKVRDAQQAQKALEVQVEKEARKAAEAVRASYRDQLRVLYAATSAARQALQDNIDAEATHEWEGKRVSKTTHEFIKRWSPETREVITLGVVEIRRSETRFPENKHYGLPDQGEAFVRLLKKDGTPGLNFSRLSSEWTLADEQVAA